MRLSRKESSPEIYFLVNSLSGSFYFLIIETKVMGFLGKYYIVIYMQTMLYNSPLMSIHDVAIILTHFCINIYTKYFRTLINQAPPSPFLALSWGVTLNLFMLFVICGQDGCICFSFYVFVFCNVMYM